ncbi:N-acetylglucosamine-6-phosphate deacetylase [Paenarthrobacter sp. DKR-5]|uniref:N-acetylglucosamine-6-phosphate deacetylase n=1 Tax=Paenarthrobacter sp. DKR-5 TaxID=2835535 RepID=UPI001BDDC386|nr:N-acetylglucosamine-6-phosphate deacetylase [Paenarthrobacter sp. DKR-5]MBT1003347.1 N-acetylglucosamine-6-phosphate deacetylase [Paenarthrobacter sp. DKR-5]
MILEAARVLTAAGPLEPGWVQVDGTRIAAVGAGRAEGPAARSFDGTLAPGFVDAHVHGGGGQGFDDAGPAAAAGIAAAHLRHGTTSMVASLVTAPLAALTASVRRLRALVEDGTLAGIHLEGPWLSPEHRGAHDAGQLRTPDRAEVEELLGAGGGTVRMVTIAPELKGSLEAIGSLVSRGVVVAVGHTGADYERTRAALAAGSRAGTHVFNGMRPIHHRDPGPVPALLEDPDVFAEVIADGVHLHPAIVRLVFASPARTVLVTDAMAAAAAPDGAYRLGGLDVVVRAGEARLAAGGSIAGSTLTLDAAVRYAVNVAGIPLVDAVRAATETPAQMLGLAEVGSIEASRRADLVALDADLNVEAVMRAGAWVQPGAE